MEKAFDCVWKDGLLLKLQQNKVTGRMYCWIKHYLHNRKAAVKLEMKHSRKKLFKHGVPQGGVLSPNEFLIFMNDIDEILSRKVNAVMYADDLAIWCSEESVGTTKIRLQKTMDNLAKWTDQWAMSTKKLPIPSSACPSNHRK